MKIVIWLTLFCLVALFGAYSLKGDTSPPERPGYVDRIGTLPNQPLEVRIVTDPKIEKRVEKLEAAVKTIEEHLQRRGSRY